MNEQIKPINKRISMYRKLAGYTQQSAADALGIKKNTYARMELHGNPNPDMLVKLSNLYNVSVDQLLYGIDYNRIQQQRDMSEVKRLHEKPIEFKRRPAITLTVNEENCVKVCRELSKEQRDKIMKYINDLYRDSKKEES